MLSYTKSQTLMNKFTSYLDNIVSQIITQPLNEEDKKVAFHSLEIEAKQQNAVAQYYLGVCYYYGINVDEDQLKAFNLFSIAAEKNNALAQNHVGYCYQFGRGIHKDEKKAIEYYQKSSNQGCPIGLNNLGLILYDRICPENSFNYFLKSAEKNYAPALCNLGLWCEEIASNNNKSFEYYKKSADQNYVAGVYNLAKYYRFIKPTEHNEKKAFELYTRCAEYGYPAAQNDLGYFYLTGQLIQKNDKKALEWFEKSANQNYSDAQNNLGCCYQYAMGVEKCLSLASIWYAKSANLGNSEAINNLRIVYRDLEEKFISVNAPDQHFGLLVTKKINFLPLFHQEFATQIPAVKGWVLWAHHYFPQDGILAIVLNYLIITPYFETTITKDYLSLRSYFLKDEIEKFELKLKEYANNRKVNPLSIYQARAASLLNEYKCQASNASENLLSWYGILKLIVAQFENVDLNLDSAIPTYLRPIPPLKDDYYTICKNFTLFAVDAIPKIELLDTDELKPVPLLKKRK